MPAVQYGYIPAQEDAFLAWSQNFSGLIAANPFTYGITVPQAAALAAQQSTYDSAHTAASDPITRTSITIASRNAARVALTESIRTFGSQIRLAPGVSNADKLALGLRLPNNSPQPIPAPVSTPVVSITGIGPLQLILAYMDPTSPGPRAKPPGAVGLQLGRSVGVVVATDPAQLSIVATVTRQPYGDMFQAADRGKIASYAGRWINRKGEVGPWSAIVSQTVS